MCKLQSGQSLVETLVLALALVPLLFLTIWLGKVADVQLANGAAARKLAFDCVQRRDDCSDLNNHTNLIDSSRRQFMSAPGREILSLDTLEDSVTAENRQPLWTTRNGTSLLGRFSDVSGRVEVQALNAPGSHMANSNQSWVGNVGEHLSNLAGPGRFGFELYGGFVSASVQTKLSQDAPSLEAGRGADVIPLTMRRHVAILSDDWMATGTNNGRADSLKTRVDQGQKLPFIGSVAEGALALSYSGTRAGMALMDFISLEHRASQFRWHDVDVAIIPPDRTRNGQSTQTTPAPQVPTFEGGP